MDKAEIKAVWEQSLGISVNAKKDRDLHKVPGKVFEDGTHKYERMKSAFSLNADPQRLDIRRAV